MAAALEGTATEAERAAFAQALESDPGLVVVYARQARVHVMLEACAAVREGALETCGRKLETGGQRRTAIHGMDCLKAASRVTAKRWRLAAAAAAGLLAGVAVWRAALPSVHPEGSGGAVVTVRTSLHGQWSDGREVEVGAALPAGVWLWQSGLVELVTASGTVLLVEAPAGLEIVDALHARLLSGKLVVRMPKGRSGFVVDTPELRVRDLGTEFGVSVSPAGEAQVQVFEGKVRAESADRAAGQELRAGETVRVETGGRLVAADYEEARFIRRMPPRGVKHEAGGALYSRSRVNEVRVAFATRPVVPDGDLAEWRRDTAFRSACLPPYDETYTLEGLMMYDAENLYLAAHVGDPEPLCNRAPEGFEFAGGSVVVRVSTDPALGWPLTGTLVEDGPKSYRKRPPTPDTASDRIASLILWHDAAAGRARLKLERGIDLHDAQIDPPGWRGVFRKDADGRGYTLEYVIPWRLLNAAERPPQAGDALAALWTAHWSDAEGRLARGQLVEVTNHRPHRGQSLEPQTYYQNGPSWGKALYLPRGH